MSLTQQVEQATHAWAAKGHKANRARQRRMMMAFAGHAEAAGATNPDKVGGRTVTGYWKALRASNRAYATQMDHWRAIRELWQLWGKTGEPPRPFSTEGNQQGGAAATAAGGRSPTGVGGAQPHAWERPAGRGAVALGAPVLPPSAKR